MGAILIPSEGAEHISKAICSELTSAARNQVLVVNTDDPSSKLFNALKAILPNLKVLALDPVHLVIVYLQCHFNKATPGVKLLRQIMNRFNK